MINFIVYLYLGMMIACWLVCVSDKDLKAVFKLVLCIAMACLVGMVNSRYYFNTLSLIACVVGAVVSISVYALCKSAKE